VRATRPKQPKRLREIRDWVNSTVVHLGLARIKPERKLQEPRMDDERARDQSTSGDAYVGRHRAQPFVTHRTGSAVESKPSILGHLSDSAKTSVERRFVGTRRPNRARSAANVF